MPTKKAVGRSLIGMNMPLRKRIVIYSWYPVTDEGFVVPRTASQGLASASSVGASAAKSVAQVMASRAG